LVDRKISFDRTTTNLFPLPFKGKRILEKFVKDQILRPISKFRVAVAIMPRYISAKYVSWSNEMNVGALSDYFDGVGTKILKGTEIDPTVSNGHELQGVDDFRAFLGTPTERQSIPVTYVWLDDQNDHPVLLALKGTWYDSRRGKSRSAEYRLYYPAASEDVVYRARAGDRLFLCQPKEGPLLAIFCPSGSSVEQQLLWLFGLYRSSESDLFQIDLRTAPGRHLDFAARQVLELINVEVVATEEQWLKRIIAQFGEGYPSTSEFSAFARKLAKQVDPILDPDTALATWMDFEEGLFRTLEQHLVGERLTSGFVSSGRPDVEEFLKFSLSVHNRRKSRAGYALAHHVEALLKAHGLKFKREATTEKRNGPDFLFPGEQAYHDQSFLATDLIMLGVKTTCKDRWRQVLAEANRIGRKHLLTFEPGISEAQTSEMRRENLQLVIPKHLHESYTPEQRNEILSVAEFLNLVNAKDPARVVRA
jgi:hypothetical protein